MPTDPNIRTNSILTDILKAMNRQSDLLAAQNKILEKMEKHGRPMRFTNHPYLEKTDGGNTAESTEHFGPYGSGGQPYS